MKNAKRIISVLLLVAILTVSAVAATLTDYHYGAQNGYEMTIADYGSSVRGSAFKGAANINVTVSTYDGSRLVDRATGSGTNEAGATAAYTSVCDRAYLDVSGTYFGAQESASMSCVLNSGIVINGIR